MWVRRYFNSRTKILDGEVIPWLDKHTRKKRLIKLALSCVPWEGNKRAVLRIYKGAKERGLTVDHIVPIDHPYVCGLTVPANLRMVTHAVNAAKGNKYHPDQVDALPELPEPYQLRCI